jgi:N-acetyl sugar amidotransferase
MDTTDPEIIFDDNGICNHCHMYDKLVRQHILPAPQRGQKLREVVNLVKQAGRGKPYDCVIGVSGGVDSTYVAYSIRQLGLRPLAVHLDNGWDSELAVKNIEQTLRLLDIDLYTWVLDWEEFRDLQVAFLRSSTPDSEIPSDHAIVAALHQTADKYRLGYIISGYNIQTESHLPRNWSQGHQDWRYISAVHKRFGTRPLKTFPHFGLLKRWLYRFTHRWVNILDYLDYSKANAMQILQKELGWQYYGGKHYESIYTRFYQGYILPAKFGYDKRRSHLSSQICSGELSRAAALAELREPTYAPTLQEEDRDYVIKKLELTESEFEMIMNLQPKSYQDYPSDAWLYENSVYKYLKTLYFQRKGDHI